MQIRITPSQPRPPLLLPLLRTVLRPLPPLLPPPFAPPFAATPVHVLRPRAARRLPLSMDLPCWRCERCAHALGARLRRHLFTPEARDRGYPADDPVHSFGTPEELRSEGFIVNDSVRSKSGCDSSRASRHVHRRLSCRPEHLHRKALALSSMPNAARATASAYPL
eukprot:2721363-Prymnesium_polylepis.1